MQHDDTFEDLPDELVRELRRCDEPVTMITSRVDREIGKMATVQFAGRDRRYVVRRVAWAAAAGVGVLALLLLQQQEPVPGTPTTLADLDGSGQVDIADVLHLAKQPGADQTTIDALAMQLVTLDVDRERS